MNVKLIKIDDNQYQLQALTDFSVDEYDIHEGQLGGIVSDPEIIDCNSNSWVDVGSFVLDSCRVGDNCLISNSSLVKGFVRIDNSTIIGSIITGVSTVRDSYCLNVFVDDCGEADIIHCTLSCVDIIGKNNYICDSTLSNVSIKENAAIHGSCKISAITLSLVKRKTKEIIPSTFSFYEDSTINNVVVYDVTNDKVYEDVFDFYDNFFIGKDLRKIEFWMILYRMYRMQTRISLYSKEVKI